MKTIQTIFSIAVFAAATTIGTAQDYPDEYLGLPGDNLNLYAVMNLFQESETLEGFERSLNNEDSRINNLDLNGDNLIDYITVSDFVEGNVHNIVLRSALNPKEQQDIAVFVVEKLRNGEVQIQLIGDEALYGQNYIIEPIYAETPNPGYTGDSYRRNANVVTTTYYDIATWPVIRFMYYPGYRVWRSSWYWGYYPSYWRPWRPHYWHYYYGYHYQWHNHYYNRYRHWDHYRCRSYHTHYRNHVRVYSPTVTVNINKGHYRNTYSRPDQRRAGEELYTRTASRSGTARSSSIKRNTSSEYANARMSNQRNSSTARSVAQGTSKRDRSAAVQRVNSRSTVQSNSRKSSPSVQRNNSQGRSNSSVSRAATRKSSPSVQRSSSHGRSNSAVSRTGTRKSSPSVQRSSSQGRSKSSVSKTAARKSSPTVQRSSSQGRSKSSVSRSTTRKSSPSAQRSSSRSNSSRSSSSSSRR